MDYAKLQEQQNVRGAIKSGIISRQRDIDINSGLLKTHFYGDREIDNNMLETARLYMYSQGCGIDDIYGDNAEVHELMSAHGEKFRSIMDSGNPNKIGSMYYEICRSISEMPGPDVSSDTALYKNMREINLLESFRSFSTQMGVEYWDENSNPAITASANFEAYAKAAGKEDLKKHINTMRAVNSLNTLGVSGKISAIINKDYEYESNDVSVLRNAHRDISGRIGTPWIVELCAEKENREILQDEYLPGREMGSQTININRENHLSQQRINNADYFDSLEGKISESKEMTDESVVDFENIQEPANTTKGQRFLASLRNALGRPIRAIRSLFSKPAREIMGSIGITALDLREAPEAAANAAPSTERAHERTEERQAQRQAPQREDNRRPSPSRQNVMKEIPEAGTLDGAEFNNNPYQMLKQHTDRTEVFSHLKRQANRELDALSKNGLDIEEQFFRTEKNENFSPAYTVSLSKERFSAALESGVKDIEHKSVRESMARLYMYSEGCSTEQIFGVDSESNDLRRAHGAEFLEIINSGDAKLIGEMYAEIGRKISEMPVPDISDDVSLLSNYKSLTLIKDLQMLGRTMGITYEENNGKPVIDKSNPIYSSYKKSAGDDLAQQIHMMQTSYTLERLEIYGKAEFYKETDSAGYMMMAYANKNDNLTKTVAVAPEVRSFLDENFAKGEPLASQPLNVNLEKYEQLKNKTTDNPHLETMLIRSFAPTDKAAEAFERLKIPPQASRSVAMNINDFNQPAPAAVAGNAQGTEPQINEPDMGMGRRYG